MGQGETPERRGFHFLSANICMRAALRIGDYFFCLQFFTLSALLAAHRPPAALPVGPRRGPVAPRHSPRARFSICREAGPCLYFSSFDFQRKRPAISRLVAP